MSSTAKGAAIGAVTGFLGALASGKQDKAAQLALAGAAVGGIAGYASAYYNAVATCMKKNPAWIPESNIERKGNYKAIVKEFKYKPSQGDIFTVRPLQMPATISQGQNLEFPAKFVVLTPDGGEAQARITRKRRIQTRSATPVDSVNEGGVLRAVDQQFSVHSQR